MDALVHERVLAIPLDLMLSSLLPIGAALALRTASAAVRKGDLDVASAVCRAHIAERLPGTSLPLRGLSARVAALAALCATARGDADEVNGAAALLEEDAGDRETAAARAIVDVCAAALAGDLTKVLDQTRWPAARWPELEGPVLLRAVERADRDLPHARLGDLRDLRDLRARLDSGPATPEYRARVALALARLATLGGKPEEAREALSGIPEGAPPAYRVLAALSWMDVDGAIAASKQLRPSERDAALGFGATIALRAGVEGAARLLDRLGDHISRPVREALAATHAVALARAGKAREALALLDAQRQAAAAGESSKDAAPALAIATAYTAILAGDAAMAREALRDATRADPMAASLELTALALGGDAAELAGELRRLGPLPEAYASTVRPLALAALARADALHGSVLPPWLEARPEDAPSLYAWGLVRLKQGAPEDAASALEAAVTKQPDLASIGDAPDAARLAAAAALLRRGESARARAFAASARSPRLAAVAAQLEALAVVQRSARERGVSLQTDTLPALVDGIARQGSADAASLEPLRVEIELMRARTALRAGKMDEACAALARLREVSGSSSSTGVYSAPPGEHPDVAFLGAALDIWEGRAPLEEIEAGLARALERAPEHAALHALLAEVSMALRGKDAGISVLEAARAKTHGTVLEQALASAYQSANRGLEAKRVGFATLRKSTGAARRNLVAELTGILAYESPPPTGPRDEAAVKRRPPSDPLPAEGLSERTHVLLAHAAAAGQRDPDARPQIEELIQKMKRTLMAGDVAAALSTEKQLIRLCRRDRA
ncbi:hypothetical protein [Sorangium sp. So ce861]|uniref:hypothetical protein n=1 Tax=Sorangium sp. So ce861 TaxID=3133323 RepID=UPI003F5EC12E